MQLQPRRQPGRTDRKAALYALEIVRLRAEGYTYEAIREALADVGVQLSTSTLRREMRRHRIRRVNSPPSVSPRTAMNAVASSTPTRSPSLAGRSGREVAEAFFNAHPSNPLIRLQERP